MTTINPTAAALTRPSFARVACVELRKMIDTRAGFWLLLALWGLNILAAFVSLLSGNSASHTFPRLLNRTMEPSYFLLPVIGILVVTSEFTQRTALTTFALIPNRLRVLRGKLAAGVALATASLVVGVAAAALAAALGSGPSALTAALLPQTFMFLIGLMLIGIAFGSLVLNSAPAIVAILLLPNAFSIITNDIHGLHGLGAWLNPSTSLDHLTRETLGSTQWVHVLATLAIWLALPLAIGSRRLLRRALS
jgi:ABC-2 type transport system permease protein